MWKVTLIIFGCVYVYLFCGVLFDLIRDKIECEDDFPKPVLWVLWPLALLLVLVYAPFWLLLKIFDR